SYERDSIADQLTKQEPLTAPASGTRRNAAWSNAAGPQITAKYDQSGLPVSRLLTQFQNESSNTSQPSPVGPPPAVSKTPRSHIFVRDLLDSGGTTIR
ncbi:MAG: hypothetical protein ACREO5_14685, partial [Candidatus Binatia bacterium]